MPPVTALRSPPDSRITGALSPVMTDSSTLAMPSITSPSPGITSFGSQRTTSPLRSDAADTTSTLPFPASFFASALGLGLAQAVGLRFAAAFGHGFGEVGEQDREPQPGRDLEFEAEARAA